VRHQVDVAVEVDIPQVLRMDERVGQIASSSLAGRNVLTLGGSWLT